MPKISEVAAVIARAKPSATRKADERRTSSVRIEHEPGAANVLDQRRPAGDVDLAPEVADVHIDDVGFRREAIVPHPLQQHRAGDDLAGALDEIFEQLE